MEVFGKPHASTTLPGGKSLGYLLNRSLVGPQSWCRNLKEEKNLLPLLELEI